MDRWYPRKVPGVNYFEFNQIFQKFLIPASLPQFSWKTDGTWIVSREGVSGRGFCNSNRTLKAKSESGEIWKDV